MKYALLGKVINLSQNDIIQCVTPGDHDIAIDYRGISSSIKTAHFNYVVTAADVLQSFASVPVVWDTPFADTNYTPVFGVEDLGVSGTDLPSLDYAPGDMHHKTASGIMCVVYFSAACPIVRSTLFKTNTSSPQTLSTTAPVTGLYNIDLYYVSLGNSSSGYTLSPTINWVDPTLGAQSLASPYLGEINGDASNNLQNYTVPVSCLAGSTISIAYTFASTAFAYNVSTSIEYLPNINIDLVAGTMLDVYAIGIQN